MFASTINAVNGVNPNALTQTLNGVSKRSTVCDADANGKVNVNCRRWTVKLTVLTVLTLAIAGVPKGLKVYANGVPQKKK